MLVSPSFWFSVAFCIPHGSICPNCVGPMQGKKSIHIHEQDLETSTGIHPQNHCNPVKSTNQTCHHTTLENHHNHLQFVKVCDCKRTCQRSLYKCQTTELKECDGALDITYRMRRLSPLPMLLEQWRIYRNNSWFMNTSMYIISNF